ncbi:hypothetical protein SO802_008120 [Lithocarpus litseifolius]|uniref:Protein kinase domain-containing protein n=1 Tax=Lithocarpus litseifolius TaxID=425828 RepID=A0AAW2D7P5_9ROSI
MPSELLEKPYFATMTMNWESQLIYTEAGYLYVQDATSNYAFNLTKGDPGYMARIDYDGIFRLYKHLKNEDATSCGNCPLSWTAVQGIPDDICAAFASYSSGGGFCGPNSICTTANNSNVVFFQCPIGFSPMDQSNNCSAFLNILLFLAIFVAVSYLYHKEKKLSWNIDSTLAANVRSYTYKELEEATRSFKQTVGKVAFGTVYKGVLPSNSKRFVSVKKLGKLIEEGEKEFKTEYFTTRIADFGLAKLLLAEQTRAAWTGIRGTVGYFAPEWFRKASISVKVDVYSFGVMLLEIICCKSSVALALQEEEALIDWAYECYKDKKLEKLTENDEEASNDMKRLERLVIVAIWCIQEDPSLRPSVKKITQMLEGVTEIFVPPNPSLYTSS